MSYFNVEVEDSATTQTSPRHFRNALPNFPSAAVG
jgi:hypothetical protein